MSASVVFPGTVVDAGLLADANLPASPGLKGVSADAVGRGVIAAIAQDRAEVDVAELPVLIMAKLVGLAPGPIAQPHAEERCHRLGRPSERGAASPPLSCSSVVAKHVGAEIVRQKPNRLSRRIFDVHNTVVRADSLGTFTDLKVSPDGTRLYGTSGTSLTVINTSTMTPVSVQVGPKWDPNNDFRNEYTTSIGNVALSPDGKRAYVTYGVTIAERGVGGQTSGIFFTDSQGRSWMVTGGYSAVAVFDTDPQSANYNQQIATVIVPAGVQDVAVSPDNSRLYVTSGDGKTVTVINTTNNAIVETFTTDQTSSGGRAIYVPFDWYPLYNIGAFTQYITVGQNGTVYVTDYTDGTLYAVTVGDPTVL